MAEAKKILEMIESVDVDDSDKLDEIDARVWCLLNSANFVQMVNIGYFQYNHCPDGEVRYRATKKYTRSRDDLKAIRPDGCFVSIKGSNDIPSPEKWFCHLFHVKDEKKEGYYVTSPNLPTEELAELHAIIQAIEWERNKEKQDD